MKTEQAIHLWNSEEWAKVKRSVARLQKLRGVISNEIAVEALFACYVDGIGPESVMDTYSNDVVSRNMIRRVISPVEGKNTSRLKDVRRIFFDFCKRNNINVEIKVQDRGEHKGQQGRSGDDRTNRRKKPTLLGAVDQAIKTEAPTGDYV